MKKTLKLFCYLHLANLGAASMYPVNLTIGAFAVMAYGVFSTVVIWVLTYNFQVIAGWSFFELLFITSYGMLAYSIDLLFFRQFRDIDFVVRESIFDVYLSKPISPFLMFLGSRLNLSSIGTMVYALVALSISVSTLEILSVAFLAKLFVFLFLSAIISCSITVSIASIAFRTLQTRGLFDIYEGVYETISDYPLNVFSKLTQFVFSFVIPIGFIGYYPASYLLKQTDRNLLGDTTLLVFILAALLLLSLAGFAWRSSIKRYQSSGT